MVALCSAPWSSKSITTTPSFRAGASTLIRSIRSTRTRKEYFLQVFVRDNDVDQALRVLKKKMQREGVFREMKRTRFLREAVREIEPGTS